MDIQSISIVIEKTLLERTDSIISIISWLGTITIWIWSVWLALQANSKSDLALRQGKQAIAQSKKFAKDSSLQLEEIHKRYFNKRLKLAKLLSRVSSKEMEFSTAVTSLMWAILIRNNKAIESGKKATEELTNEINDLRQQLISFDLESP